MTTWSFLTNHAHVLLCVTRGTGFRLRDIAEQVGITERAAQRIITELVDEGYLDRHREGRRNYYEVHPEAPLRHPLQAGYTVGDLIGALSSSAADRGAQQQPSSGSAPPA